MCATDETCLVIGASCTRCAQTECSKVEAPPGSGSTSNAGGGKKGASTTGPIAGGVVGGVVVIVIITYLVWRFCIKKRREEFEETEWRKSEQLTEKDGDEFARQGNVRASTHTVASMASSVVTRASNIIQIAYIPGVTNRSESSPDLLVPPVPPIPAASMSKSNLSSQPGQDQHFFMPSDLRDSRLSGYSDDMGRDSMAATYQNNVVVNPLPAQVVARGKASAVSVKSSGKNSPIDTPGTMTPPIPAIDYARHGQVPPTRNGPMVARLGVPKAVTVTKSPASKLTSPSISSASSTPPSTKSSPDVENSPAPSVTLERQTSSLLGGSRHTADASTFDDASTDDDESLAEQSLMGRDRRSRIQEWGSGEGSGPKHSSVKAPLSAPNLRQMQQQSPPMPPSETASGNALKQSHQRSGSLNQIIEEAARRASRDPRHGGLGSIGGWGGGGGVGGVGSLASWQSEGPFADSNAARTP